MFLNILCVTSHCRDYLFIAYFPINAVIVESYFPDSSCTIFHDSILWCSIFCVLAAILFSSDHLVLLCSLLIGPAQFFPTQLWFVSKIFTLFYEILYQQQLLLSVFFMLFDPVSSTMTNLLAGLAPFPNPKVLEDSRFDSISLISNRNRNGNIVRIRIGNLE